MTRLISLAVFAAYIVAVTLPCPIQTQAAAAPENLATQSQAHSHHDAPSIAMGETTPADCSAPVLTAPCPCGCERYAGAAPGAKRLGKILVPEIETAQDPLRVLAQTPLVQRLREHDASPLDPVPIPA